jgi:hypothetical protein
MIESMSINSLRPTLSSNYFFEIEILAYIYFRLHPVYFTWNRYSAYENRHPSFYEYSSPGCGVLLGKS